MIKRNMRDIETMNNFNSSSVPLSPKNRPLPVIPSQITATTNRITHSTLSKVMNPTIDSDVKNRSASVNVEATNSLVYSLKRGGKTSSQITSTSNSSTSDSQSINTLPNNHSASQILLNASFRRKDSSQRKKTRHPSSFSEHSRTTRVNSKNDQKHSISLADTDTPFQIAVTANCNQYIQTLERDVQSKHHDRCFCGWNRGLHILVWSILSTPFIMIYAFSYAFYHATLIWYSTFLSLSENQKHVFLSVILNIILCPTLILLYPVWLISTVLSLTVCVGVKQVSWYFQSWLDVLHEPDLGFFPWFCSKLGRPEFAPYLEVVLAHHSDDNVSSV